MSNLRSSSNEFTSNKAQTSPQLHHSPSLLSSLEADAQSIAATYPLAPMQQGMLFHNLYAEQSGVDIEQMICTLHEPLNLSYFEQAWQRVVERHTVLRTSFHWAGLAQPEQRVQEQASLPLIQEDWRDLSAEVQHNRLQAYLQHDRQQGFDLSQAPLMRLRMFQLADAEYQLVWSFHHILLDGRSFSILLKEVFDFYQAFCSHEDLQLASPLPYQTYIEWLQQQNWSHSEAYWQQLLDGFTVPTSLPLQPSEPVESVPGHDEVSIRFSKATTASLQAIATQHNFTLNTIVQGAWALLLQPPQQHQRYRFWCNQSLPPFHCGRCRINGGAFYQYATRSRSGRTRNFFDFLAARSKSAAHYSQTLRTNAASASATLERCTAWSVVV